MRSPFASISALSPLQAGFSLPGVSLAVMLLGLGAAVAVPAYQRHEARARQEATAAQLRAIAQAFMDYAKDHGDWPTGGLPPAAVPPGMERYLAGTAWTDSTPLGGHYEWVTQSPQNGGRYAAAIVLTFSGTTRPARADEEAVDRLLDDGDLTSGAFFLGYRDQPVYVLEH